MNYGNAVKSPPSRGGIRKISNDQVVSRNSSRQRTVKKRDNSVSDNILTMTSKKESQKQTAVSQPKNEAINKTDKYYCVYPNNGYNIIKAVFANKPGWKEVKKDDLWRLINTQRINFIWKPVNYNYKMYCSIDNAHHRCFQKKNSLYELVVNHLEGHRDLTTKTGLVRSLKYYYKDNVNFVESNYQVFETTPTTFVVSSNLETYEYYQFIRRFQDLTKGEGQTIKERVPQKHCHKNMWLVKPANENQGKGIKIFHELDHIVRFLESSIKFSYWVIQKYLEKPLLYKGRKFDIRLWAFAHSCQDFYVYDTGYIRTSSENYSSDNTDNEYIHLTNNCLQIKNKDSYGLHEEGNTVSFGQFEDYLKEQFPQHKLQFDRDFLKRMKDIAVDCYMSVKQTLNPNKRKNCFEFFGFDFMIDEDFRVWLIEVNTNPYIGIHNQQMKHILPEMFESLYKIVIDPIHSDDVVENPHEGTGFDLLYSRQRGVFNRRPAQEGIYPIKELDQRPVYPKHNYRKKNFAKFVSDFNVTSIDNSTEYIEDEDKKTAAKITQKPKFAQKMFSPQKISNRKNSLLRISNLELNQDPSLTVRNKNMSPDPGETEFPNRRGSMLKVNLGVDPPKPKPPKTIVQQVKNMDKKSVFAKEQGAEVINRIFAVFKSWELFSDEQIIDAITALQMLEQVFVVFQADDQKQIIDASVLLIGSNDAPMHIRQKLAQNLCVMMKNKNLIKQLFQDPNEAFQQLNHIFKVIHESHQQQTDDQYQSTDQEELYMHCATILVSVLSLNARKFYIPGETHENSKLRQRAMDCGILIILMCSFLKLQDSSLKQYLKEEFFERLEEQDIDYHFNNNHIQYETVQGFIEDSSVKQKIDEQLHQRLLFLQEARERDHKIQVERQKEQDQRELQLKLEYDMAMQEKRRQAEVKMQQRLKQLQKLQANQHKLEIQMKEEQDQINEIKKQEMIEDLKKKQEQRKQQQMLNIKKQKVVEKEIEEERERDRVQRDQHRKQALAEWHHSKRAEEKKKQTVSKVISKKPTSMNQNTDLGHRKKSVQKRNPQSFDTAFDVPQQAKNLIDESFLSNVKISQLNKIQQNIQLITQQRVAAGSMIQNGQKRLSYLSPQYDRLRFTDEDQHNQTFQKGNEDDELIKMRQEREKKEHLYKSAVQHLKQIKNIEKSYELDKSKKTYKQKFRQDQISQIGTSTSQPRIMKDQYITDRVTTETSGNMKFTLDTKSKESYNEKPVMVLNRKNLVLKHNSQRSSQEEEEEKVTKTHTNLQKKLQMPFLKKESDKIKIKDEFSLKDNSSEQMIEADIINGLPKIKNGSELYYYDEVNSSKLDDLINKQQANGRHNLSVYTNSNQKPVPQQRYYTNGARNSQVSSPVYSQQKLQNQDQINMASHQISPKSFEITPHGDRQGISNYILDHESPMTSQRVNEVSSLIAQQKLNSPLGVTIINNDYSNINFTQNISIEKYVKKKKNVKNKKYEKALAYELLSEFTTKKGQKGKKSKKQKQKEQFIQIYNVPNIKTGGKVLSSNSGISSQISLGPQNKLREKVQQKGNPMVIEGNIGHISIARRYDDTEEEPNQFYARKASQEDYASLRVPSIQSRQSIENNENKYRLIKLKEKNLKQMEGLNTHKGHHASPQIFFPEIDKKHQAEFLSLKNSYEGNHGSRSASLS